MGNGGLSAMGTLIKTVEHTSELPCGRVRNLEVLSTNSCLSSFSFEGDFCGANILFLASPRCEPSAFLSPAKSFWEVDAWGHGV